MIAKTVHTPYLLAEFALLWVLPSFGPGWPESRTWPPPNHWQFSYLVKFARPARHSQLFLQSKNKLIERRLKRNTLPILICDKPAMMSFEQFPFFSIPYVVAPNVLH